MHRHQLFGNQHEPVREFQLNLCCQIQCSCAYFPQGIPQVILNNMYTQVIHDQQWSGVMNSNEFTNDYIVLINERQLNHFVMEHL